MPLAWQLAGLVRVLGSWRAWREGWGRSLSKSLGRPGSGVVARPLQSKAELSWGDSVGRVKSAAQQRRRAPSRCYNTRRKWESVFCCPRSAEAPRPGRRLGQAQATRRQGGAPLAPPQPHGGEPHPHLCPASSPSLRPRWSFGSMRSHAARWCTASRVELVYTAGFWLPSCICVLGSLHLSKRGWCDDESGGPSQSPSRSSATLTVWSPFQLHLPNVHLEPTCHLARSRSTTPR